MGLAIGLVKNRVDKGDSGIGLLWNRLGWKSIQTFYIIFLLYEMG
jgi:hypothetical protein